MSIEKLNGVIEAIEAESKQPSPSHANLARLVAMFFREFLDEAKAASVPHGTFTAVAVTPPEVKIGFPVPELENVEVSPKKRSRSKPMDRKSR